MLYDALVDAGDPGPRAKGPTLLRGQARRPPLDAAGDDQRPARPRRPAGQRVVRLKCGDPFVLGRGGEEALALAAAGIPFEVVPGVTTAVAAPALAGIPVTHRGYASGFVVVSGHAEEAYGPAIDSVAPRSLTVIVLMGVSSRARLASRMCARGWPSDTPAAVLLAASTPSACAWRGTLGELGDAALPPGDLPGHHRRRRGRGAGRCKHRSFRPRRRE